MIDVINEITKHPATSTTAGVTTTIVGVANKAFEYMPIVHDIFSYGCMTVGLIASILGIMSQIKSWKSRDITDRIELLKLKQLEALEKERNNGSN